MNKKQLEYFMETYHYRNIQAAADNLYISHQGLSRVIRSLEDELGQALFVRSNRGLEPTDFATTLLPHIQSLLDTYARIEGVQTLAGQKKSVVTVYALDHVLGYLGAEFIIYPRRMPFFVVKHRTNTYFRQTEYAERNNVYTHKYATNTYILQKNAIDIIAEANDTKSLRAILDYLTHVFGMNEIGLSISSPKYYSYFNELNYIKI